ncbi:MAG: Uncharacterized protein XD91_0962 [Clostridiales bacterium 38_11]|nr:MAG: Uncharacterized protein XD91_0962 [Clostridiales bacterium 38_11]HBH13553.1 hypothetical protein [Clostridiales bacterium]
MTRNSLILNYQFVKEEAIPDIELYMDQVTNYLENQLNDLKIDQDEKTLTKTMINNYVKNELIDKPIKKKYKKTQIMQLIMLYQLKNILSINQIKELMQLLKREMSSTEIIYRIYSSLYEEICHSITATLTDNPTSDIIVNPLKSYDGSQGTLRLILESDIKKRLALIKIKD